MHSELDLDASPKSGHHTLGRGRSQAAYGDHKHDNAESPLIGNLAYMGWLTTSPVGFFGSPEKKYGVGCLAVDAFGAVTNKGPDAMCESVINMNTAGLGTGSIRAQLFDSSGAIKGPNTLSLGLQYGFGVEVQYGMIEPLYLPHGWSAKLYSADSLYIDPAGNWNTWMVKTVAPITWDGTAWFYG